MPRGAPRAAVPDAGGTRTGASIEVSDLTWRPYGAPTPVLDRVSLRVEPGERVLLAGPSGSGKSTLLRAVAGLLLTTGSGELTGAVHVDGRDPQQVPGTVGMVLQDPGSGVVASTVGRDIAFGLENVRLPAERMPEPVAGALREVRLVVDESAPPSTLSGGEQQRLALAGALALGPQVLLLDEPLAMLDAETATVVRDVVLDVVSRRGLTLVVVEHRLGPWAEHLDRLVVLGHAGSTVADGGCAEVLRDHADTLLDAGIWVPGHCDPEPLRLDLGWGPPAVTCGGAVVEAEAVGATLRSRSLATGVREVQAVRDVDLEVRAGRLHALVGPSGSGKSTLLTLLGGLLPPSAGRVRWPDPPDIAPHRLPSTELARRVAWVPQRASSLIVSRTVAEEVLATPAAIGMGGPEVKARAETLLQRFGLAERRDLDPRQLSGGEQRRLAVAAALVHQPTLVLADEPTVGQDRHTWAAVTGALAAVRSAGSGIVVSTHDPALLAHADSVTSLVRPPVPDRPQAEPRAPLAARAGPLALLAAAGLALPLPAVVDTWPQALTVVLAELLLAGVALLAPGRGARPTGRVRRLLGRLVAPAVAVVTVAWSTWLLGGHDLAESAMAGLRVLSIILPSVVLLPYLDPDSLGDHLAQRLRLPPRPVVALSVALQRFQALGELWTELTLARRVRGLGRRAIAAGARPRRRRDHVRTVRRGPR